MMHGIFKFMAIALALLVLAAVAAACNGDDQPDAPPNGEENGNGNGEENGNGNGEENGNGNGEENGNGNGNGEPVIHGRLESLGGGTVLRLWGDASDRGYAEGALLCDKVTALLEDFVLGHVVAGYGLDYAALRSQVVSSSVYGAADISWMEGVLAGMEENCPAGATTLESPHLEAESQGSRELEIEDLMVGNTLADWACSSFSAWGAATETGDLIHARNLDYIVDARGTIRATQIVKLIHAEERSARYVSVSWPGMIGCISCIADDGTLLMVHDSNGLSPSTQTGLVPRQIAMREGLFAARNAADPVAAAKEVLDALPQHRGNNFHLAAVRNSTPVAAVFEYDGNAAHADGLATVRTVQDNAGTPETTDGLVCTNHYRKRRSPVLCTRYSGLSTALDHAAAGTGLDVAGSLELIGTVAFQGSTQTVHTVILDAATSTLYVHLSRDPGVPATSVEPQVINLNADFDSGP